MRVDATVKTFANSIVLVREVRVVLLQLGDGGALEEHTADLAHREASPWKDGLTAQDCVVLNEPLPPFLEARECPDLLFPAITGGFRTQKVLNVPIAETAAELGIKKHLTQRALRRTFNDLARAAQVNDLVTRSISGHLTGQMQHHYSTVNGAERRAALAKVIRLVDARSARPPRSASSTGAGGEDGGEGQPSSGEESKTG